jgi:5-methylcytosine-specific restriction endonuclease McrA
MKGYIGPKTKNYKKTVEKVFKKPSLSTLKGELQKVFNEFIRKRDTVYMNGLPCFTCISCGILKPVEGHMHAGHFWPVGGNEAVRFDEDNCHGQCLACNHFKHGNLSHYGPNLEKKIGKEKFKMLAIKRLNRSKMMAFEVEYLIEEYKTKIKSLTHGK